MNDNPNIMEFIWTIFKLSLLNASMILISVWLNRTKDDLILKGDLIKVKSMAGNLSLLFRLSKQFRRF